MNVSSPVPAHATAASPLLAYPHQAALGRIVPKNKIYEQAGVKGALRELFVQQIDKIVWQYKLAPETINLAAKPGVPEIQVFAIELKTPEVHLDVLRRIDSAIAFPIIFEVSFNDGDMRKTQVIAAHKRPNEADTKRWVVSRYFASPWISSDTPRRDMPLALDLAGLYEQILQGLIALPKCQSESLADLLARFDAIVSKQRELDNLASKLAKEKQFNRQVEINQHLRTLTTEIKQLQAGSDNG